MTHRFGTVALVGRPNAGKSTLLNAVLGERIAAVSPRPQTTRNRVAGIVTSAEAQVVLLDTPGWHRGFTPLNQRMVAVAEAAMEEADLVCWVVDCTREFDAELAERIGGRRPVVALNKVDLAVEKAKLLPVMERYGALGTVVPVSAAQDDGLDRLRAEWIARLPVGPAVYPADQLTDAPEKFVAAEFIREQVFLRTEQEVPYGVAVEVERFDESERERGRLTIHARIVVEKDSHKAILVGRRGSMVKAIGTAARQRIEALTGAHVVLKLFVAVERDWTRRPRLVQELGG